ncbi:dephospho-CoA kinase [Gemmobacter sp.]|uniref:dephospho-CoA kinase n=1 Tax=Gemmobacter sp. TaxID=1898957 RepID=UPI002AFDCAD6|nr:dephospho-CoA kinase [Gemmobacter sp.]
MTRYILGLTGGIGMGKSTTAQMFAAEGVPVWDADSTVHRLYSAGGAAVAPLSQAFPEALVDGAIDRGRLKACIAADPAALKRIESIVHPLVGQDRVDFLARTDADIVLLDIPLLFEGTSASLCDGVAVVSVPADVQRARVLARGTMTAADLDRILANQMPDAEKRARATWVIDTSTLDGARAKVRAILSQIRETLSHA